MERLNEILKSEKIKGFKNFRQMPDVENFYRFIYDNGLRQEAKLIFETAWGFMQKKKKKKRRRKKAVLH